MVVVVLRWQSPCLLAVELKPGALHRVLLLPLPLVMHWTCAQVLHLLLLLPLPLLMRVACVQVDTVCAECGD